MKLLGSSVLSLFSARVSVLLLEPEEDGFEAVRGGRANSKSSSQFSACFRRPGREGPGRWGVEEGEGDNCPLSGAAMLRALSQLLVDFSCCVLAGCHVQWCSYGKTVYCRRAAHRPLDIRNASEE